MTDTIVSSGTNVKFIGATTPMTQANWQDYFGTLHKSGVLEGFGVINGNVYDGAAIVNGIIAKIVTELGYTPFTPPSDQEIDALILIRVYLKQQKVELIRRTGIAAGSSYQNCADVIVNLIQNEDAYCTRNDDYYEMTLGYINAAVDYRYTINCRRFSTPPSGPIQGSDILQGNQDYFMSGAQNYRIDPFNPPERIKIFDLTSYNIITFSKYFYLAYNSTVYDTNVAPLVYAAVPITFYYNNSDFTVDGVTIKHTTTKAMAMFEVVRYYKNTVYSVTVTE